MDKLLDFLLKAMHSPNPKIERIKGHAVLFCVFFTSVFIGSALGCLLFYIIKILVMA